MRRLARTLLLCVLVGAALNVAVAWYLATKPSVDKFTPPTEYAHFQYPDMSLLDAMRYDKVGTMYVAISYLNQRYTPVGWDDDVPGFLEHQPRFVQRILQDWYGDLERPMPPSQYMAVIARGWPMMALYSVEESDYRRRGPGTRAEFIDRGAIVIPVQTERNEGYSPFRAVALPYLPIWGGFLLNTLLYAALVSLPLLTSASARRLRRWRRTRRGRCPKCGYDLRGQFDAGCSECGWRRVT